jgi:hypothetical protein
MANNLKKYALNATATLHLRNGNDELMYADGPDGMPDESKPMRVRMFGPGTKQYAAAVAAANNRNMDRMKRKGKADMTAEDKIKETATFLSACTDGFENVEWDGLAGRDLYMAAYSDLELCFIPMQIDKWLGDTANFTKESAGS